MAAITSEDVKKAVTEALTEHRKTFWVEPEEHYLQHKFVAGMMGARNIARKTGLTVVVTAVVGWLVKVGFDL